LSLKLERCFQDFRRAILKVKSDDIVAVVTNVRFIPESGHCGTHCTVGGDREPSIMGVFGQ